MSLYAVIIAGGRGKRFWPSSRMHRPKYLLSVFGQKNTLLQQAVRRLKGIVDNRNIIVVTNKLQVNEVKKQLPQIHKGNIIAEPLNKNTAAAIGLAATIISAKNPEAVMVVLPADQIVLEENKFKQTIKVAAGEAALNNIIVTVGIKPTFPSTGFGYIKTGEKVKNNIFNADAFIEKPNFIKAKQFLKNKNYFWNGGIFISKACVMLNEINKYMPKLSRALGFIKMYIGTSKFANSLTRHYKSFKDTSIDYGVMEKSKKVCVAKGDFQLYDIGSWKNVAEIIRYKEKNNIVIGRHECIDTKNSIIVSHNDHLIGTIGLRDVIIIHTDDVTLVCRKDKSELVKSLVEKIEKKGLTKFL